MRKPLKNILKAAAVFAALTIGFSAFVIVLAGRLMAQEAGCYQIDRFGVLCIPSTGEIFVDTAHYEYAWINDLNYKAADGTHCCGESDCKEIDLKDVSEAPGGLMTPYGVVAPRGTYQSRDGKTWVCRRHMMNATPHNSCLFIPGGG